MDRLDPPVDAPAPAAGITAAELLPLVYDELRRLAAHKLAAERPGQTLQPTALVHEAYLRLVAGAQPERNWHGRTHFFAAAAEAMRRILIDGARHRSAARHGGDRKRVEFDEALSTATIPGASAAPDDLIALDAALARLEAEDKPKADLVKLHYFVGLGLDEAADALGISRATAYRHWTYARAWLHQEIRAAGA